MHSKQSFIKTSHATQLFTPLDGIKIKFNKHVEHKDAAQAVHPDIVKQFMQLLTDPTDDCNA